MKVGDLVKVKPSMHQLAHEPYDSIVGIVTNVVNDPCDGRSYIDVIGPHGPDRWSENECWVLVLNNENR